MLEVYTLITYFEEKKTILILKEQNLPKLRPRPIKNKNFSFMQWYCKAI